MATSSSYVSFCSFYPTIRPSPSQVACNYMSQCRHFSACADGHIHRRSSHIARYAQHIRTGAMCDIRPVHHRRCRAAVTVRWCSLHGIRLGVVIASVTRPMSARQRTFRLRCTLEDPSSHAMHRRCENTHCVDTDDTVRRGSAYVKCVTHSVTIVCSSIRCPTSVAPTRSVD